MLEKGYYDKADTIIKSHGAMEASLIPIIQDIQSEYRYLPPELLSYVADQIGITEAKAFSVATFYSGDGILSWCLRSCTSTDSE